MTSAHAHPSDPPFGPPGARAYILLPKAEQVSTEAAAPTPSSPLTLALSAACGLRERHDMSSRIPTSTAQRKFSFRPRAVVSEKGLFKCSDDSNDEQYDTDPTEPDFDEDQLKDPGDIA
ncbi:hypothetical protein PEBR_07864 [Penicillium brasilianum]|uniref:Uncharacterized protein n=1 Tax=Penicillium brasilianum TaxID=104259 RepID=A0A1S9RVJ0_PENBI|nr:hypothetical protein PEBR_07864 [Penicillium brasilianum]